MFTKTFAKFAFLALALGVIAGSPVLHAAEAGKTHHLVFQVIDNDPGRWKQTLAISRNLIRDMGKDNVAIEIVVHGGGINMARKDSEVAELLGDVQKQGAVIAACAQSMKGLKVSADDLHSGVRVVEFGAKELMEKQEAGWTYIRM